MKNYYEILNINSNSSIKEIKHAYRKLAFKYHPDVNKERNAAQNFIKVTEAYEVLGNSSSKSEYDILFKIVYTSSAKQEFDENQEYVLDNFVTKYQDLGKKRADRYSKIPYKEFVEIIFKEVSIGSAYIPNILTISFILAMIFGIYYFIAFETEFKKDYPAVIFFLVISLPFFYVVKKMISIAKDDYLEDRKINNLNKKKC